MADQDYDHNAPYAHEKTVKGGAFVRGAVLAVLLGATAIGGTYWVMTAPPTDENSAFAQNEGAYQVAAGDAASTSDTGYNNLLPPPEETAKEPAPAQTATPARRVAPRPAPPPAAEPQFTPSSPPELPAPANPDMTIPDIVEPLPPTEG